MNCTLRIFSLLSLAIVLASCVAEAPEPTVTYDFTAANLVINSDTLFLGDTLEARVMLGSVIPDDIHFQWAVFDTILNSTDSTLRLVASEVGEQLIIVEARDGAETLVWSDTAEFYVGVQPSLEITVSDSPTIFSPVLLSATLTNISAPVTYRWKYAEMDTVTLNPELRVRFTEVGSVSISCEAKLKMGGPVVAADTLLIEIGPPSLKITEQQLHEFSIVEFRCYARFEFTEWLGNMQSTGFGNLVEDKKTIDGWSDTGTYYIRNSSKSDSAWTSSRNEAFITSIDWANSTLRSASLLKDIRSTWHWNEGTTGDYLKLESIDLHLISFNADSAVFARGGKYCFQARVSSHDRTGLTPYFHTSKDLIGIAWDDPAYPVACYVVFKK